MTAGEHFQFLRGLITRPSNVGAIAPSGRALSRAIAAQIDLSIPGGVLELGPGTGVVTQAIIDRGIAPERITAVEYDEKFAEYISSRFPRVRVIRGDAFSFDPGAEQFAAIVSGLPLLNHPVERRKAFIENALSRLAHGAPYIQFSYGLGPPIPAPSGATVHQAAFVLFNLPPARVWVYRRL